MFKSLLRSSSIPLRTLAGPSTSAATVSPFLRTFSTATPQYYKADKDSHAYKYLHEKTPVETKFTEEHEYVKLYDDDSALIGITQYAAQALGDVTFVELPELGTRVEIGETLGSVESVKSASEIYSPVSGEVVGVNEHLESEPGVLNHDPTVEGWIAHIKLDDPKQVTESETLLSTEDYAKSLEED
ncbi:GCV3 [Candida theae]|uniref:Glycine cleavage system H protein n=1 Tax=Candida theae TaxID=1198502 RepID=A0AAD5FWS1_9ASCO|nr:GCV3 [Candida theae]KAI5949760.1 GCV3 [Candida theae]